MCERKGSCGCGIIFPLIFIFLGFLFLFENFGILPFGFWQALWKFWPLILVFIGLSFLFSHFQKED